MEASEGSQLIGERVKPATVVPGEVHHVLEQTSNAPNERTCQRMSNDRAPAETHHALRYNIIAYLLVVATGALEVASASSIQSLDRSVPHAEVNIARYCCQFILLLPYVVKSKISLKVERCLVMWVIANMVVVYTLNACKFGSAYYVSVGSASSIFVSVTMITLAIVSVVLGNWTKSSLISVLTCTVGILLVAQPDFIFRSATNEYEEQRNMSLHQSCFSLCVDQTNVSKGCQSFPKCDPKEGGPCRPPNTTGSNTSEGKTNDDSLFHDYDQYERILGYSLATVAGFFDAVSSTLYKQPLSNVPPVVVAFWISLPAIGISLVQMLATEIPTFPRCWFCILMLLVHAFSSAATSILWIIAMYMCTSPLVATILYSATVIPGSFGVQYTLLANMYPGHRNWMEYLGALICLLGAIAGPIWLLWSQIKERRATHQPPGN